MILNGQEFDSAACNQYIVGSSTLLSEWFRGVTPFVDLTVTSPPYWDMKDYEGNREQIGFGQSYERYLEDIKVIFQGTYDISKSSANLVLIVDTMKKDGKMVRLPDDMARTLETIGWIHQDTIIWDKVKTLPWSRKGQMRNVFEYILIFSKTPDYKYNAEAIRLVEGLKEWWIGYPERYNPQGKLPDNIWQFLIPTQGSWGSKQDFGEEEFRHACPFPPELMTRLIKVLSDNGDVVFDPFAGTGVLLATAQKLNRKYFGLDVNESYKKVFAQVTIPLVDSVWSDIERYYTIQEQLKSLMQICVTKLRILKYPQALMKKFKKCNDFYMVICTRKELHDKERTEPYIVAKADYKLFVKEDGDLNDLSRKCRDMVQKAPFTKYGLISSFEVLPKTDLRQALEEITYPVYVYKGLQFGNFEMVLHNQSELENLLGDPACFDKLFEKNICPTFSNVRIEKSDYELLPAEEYKKFGYREEYSQETLDKVTSILNMN